MSYKLFTPCLSAALGALLLVFAGAASAMPPAAPPATPGEVLQYLAQHRQNVALVSFTVDEHGGLIPTDPVIRHNPNLRVPLASTVKILHLATYAREVAAGRLDPQTPIRCGEWDNFYLPGADGGAHAATYAALGVATDAFGRALDPNQTLPLDLLLAAMIRFSDNAAPDLLLARLGLTPFQATLAELGLHDADLPLSFLGGVLARYNFENGSLTPRRLRALARLRPAARWAYFDALAARFAHDTPWREQQIAWYLGPELTLDYALERSAVEQLTASGTAENYARLMAGVVTGTLLTPEASAVMRRHLELPLAPGAPFESVGIKGGTLAGVLNDATWAIPAVGDFAGQRRITVMLLKGLTEPIWTHLQTTFVHQELLFLIAFDRATAQAAELALRPRRGRR